MTKKKVYYASALFMCVIILFFLQRKNIERCYYKLVKKNAIIEHYNSKGQLEGEFVSYKNGNLYVTGNFHNGLKQGWAIRYYDNGQIKNMKFYNRDAVDGMEKEFYESGNLDYSVLWRNNKPYGNEYHYLDNKMLANYDAFDVLNLFCYLEYDSHQRISKYYGSVFSHNIYSMDKNRDTIIVLKKDSTYDNINDLYITVATPPQFMPRIDLYINHKPIENFKLIENTIRIENAIKAPGVYFISIKGKLLYSNGMVFKSDSADYKITRNN